MTDRELMQMANRIEALAFEMKAPNAHTPQFVMLANEIRARARLAQPEPEELGEIVPANEEQLKRIAKLVEPEPVAWYYAGSDVEPNSVALDADLDAAQKANCIPLYAVPPQREWQGLTDEELLDIADMAYANDLELLQTLQAKLKEKNHG